MDVVVVSVFFILALFALVKRWSAPPQELIDDYYKIANVKVWLQEQTIQFGERKMPVGEISRLTIEGRGKPNKLPTLVVYFFAPDVEEWEIARFPPARLDEANSAQSLIREAVEKATGRSVVCVDRFSD
ncbi:hypothetical protein EXU34_18685 [Alteromonas sp. ZYF713]|nr:hypothetical protein [Alteromonas sp. ZYF713]